MGTFLTDGASELPDVKGDVRAPTGATTEWAADDANRLRMALIDVRNGILGIGPGDRDANGMLVTSTGSTTARTLAARAADVVNVKDFGATGNGVTDDTAAIQALINSAGASGGGVLFFPPGTYLVANLIMRDGVVLRTLGSHHLGASTLKNSATSGWVIDSPVGGVSNASIEGFTIQGPTAATPAIGGFRQRGGYWNSIKNCYFNGFSDPSIQIDDGSVATTIEDVLAINGLLNRSRGAAAGVIDIHGADHLIYRTEANASLTGISNASLYVNAFAIRGANHIITSCVGEVSDRGFYITASLTRFLGTRADSNWGHGFGVSGTYSNFTSCLSYNNGRAAANTYDGWDLRGSFGNAFAACTARVATTTHRYGFNDDANFSSVLSRNTYSACASSGHGTAAFKTESYLGSGMEFAPHPIIPSAGPTIDVSQTSLVKLNDIPAGTTITGFTGGVSGQTIRLVGHPNVTIQYNGTIRTSTRQDKTLAQGLLYTFTYVDSIWDEVSTDTVGRTVINYSASIAINASLGNEFVTSASDGSGFTIGAPTYPNIGQRITIRVRNTSGGALGTITWDGVYKMATWTNPANGYSRSIDFQFNGTNWVEVSRTPGDVPN